MGTPRLSKILIGALMIGLFSLSFMLFLSDGAEEYSVTGYTNSSLESFSSTSGEIETISNAARNNLSQTGAINNGFDIFGSFFSNAWTALKSTWEGMTTLSSLSTQAVDEIPIINDQFSNQLKVFLTTTVAIIFVIAIYFSFIKNSNRL